MVVSDAERIVRFNVIVLSHPAAFLAVSYTHLRAHETVLDLVCRLLLEKKKQDQQHLRLAHTKLAKL